MTDTRRQTTVLVLYYKIIAHKYINNIELYGGGAILVRMAEALAPTRLRFNRPKISFSRVDFGWHMEMASLEATEEMMAVASMIKKIPL